VGRKRYILVDTMGLLCVVVAATCIFESAGTRLVLGRKQLAGQKGFAVLSRRWVVKRTFAWLSSASVQRL
jgi:hypothetical protein